MQQDQTIGRNNSDEIVGNYGRFTFSLVLSFCDLIFFNLGISEVLLYIIFNEKHLNTLHKANHS